MTEDPGTRRDALPDSGVQGSGTTGGDALPDFGGAATDQERIARTTEGARRRSRSLVLTVIGASVIALAVIALVLSQTLFRGALSDDSHPAAAPSVGTATGHSEYVPDPKDPQLEPPPPIFTEKPTTECVASGSTGEAQLGSGRTLSSGGLQVTIPQTWTTSWVSGDVAFLQDGTGYARNVEGSWYSVVNIGRVWWPSSVGSYPGSEQAAITLFQCYTTAGGLREYFGDHPNITDYRSEATSVDGSPAWIVQATYHFEDSPLSTSSASVVTSIVVETPDGPSALVSDVAADHSDHVQELRDIIASMKVTS